MGSGKAYPKKEGSLHHLLGPAIDLASLPVDVAAAAAMHLSEAHSKLW